MTECCIQVCIWRCEHAVEILMCNVSLIHAYIINNNDNGHIYGAWSLARYIAHCTVQEEAEKFINKYNGQNKKVSGHMTAKPQYNTIQNTIQYNFIAKCQYNCTRNVLWCHVHSSYIQSNHETSLNYNSK